MANKYSEEDKSRDERVRDEELLEYQRKRLKKKRESKSSALRFRDMLRVLKKHKLVRGISPKKLKNIFEDMGPTYVKLGQIMSMRSDILPSEYCEELALLRADVKPLEFDKIKKTIQENYSCPLDEIFELIDEKPFGSASIAQVHKAVLKETGDKVVIKVQRPHVKEVMAQDIVLMRKAAKVLGALSSTDGPLDFDAIIDELWETTKQEMDFSLECKNIIKFREQNEGIKYVDCPRVYEELSSAKVLVMEEIQGVQIDNIEALESMGYDMNEIGIKLAQNYCKQIIDDAFFHADPHPGNIWIRDGKIVFLDFGMMGTVTNRDKNLFGKAMLAAMENDVSELKNIVLTLGVVRGTVNHTRLYTDIDDMLARYGDMGLSNINLGSMIEELLRAAKNNNIALPSGITMLGRGAVTIEGVLSRCSPEVDIMTIIANHMSYKVRNETDPRKDLLTTLRNSKLALESTVKLPSQMSNLLQMLIKGQSKLNLEIMGSDEPMTRVESMVNRLIVCIIAAALLMSSATIYNEGTSNHFWGFPILGALGFFAAVALAGGLLISIVYKRRKNRRKNK